MKKSLKGVAACLLLVAANCQQDQVFAQGSAITYQGRLSSSGSPLSGNYDLIFTIYSSSSAGNVIGGPVTNSAVAVTNGLFTTQIDFGPGAFAGTNNWLAIGVSTNGANSFITLLPRQPITPTPIALYAVNALAATSAGSVPAANIIGTLGLNQLPAAVVTNGGKNLNLTGTFNGNGASLTNVNATSLSGLTTNDFVKRAGDSMSGPLSVTASLNPAVSATSLATGGVGLSGNSGPGSGGAGLKGFSGSSGDGLLALQNTSVKSRGLTAGAYIESSTLSGNGLVSVATNGFAAYAIWGIAPQGKAGVFEGDVQVNGALNASSTGTVVSASSSTLNASAIKGLANNGSFAVAVEGDSASGIGVKGYSSAVNGWGILGIGTNSGALAGYFQGKVQVDGGLTAAGTSTTDGLIGLQATSAKSQNATAGVYAESSKLNGTGLWAVAPNGSSATAIVAYAPQGQAAVLQGNVILVGQMNAASTSGTTINANSSGSDASAIIGTAETGSYAIGVEGDSTGGIGVKGYASAANGWGVLGIATNTGALAGYFQGNVQVDGTTTTKVLTITGGADLAEPFHITSTSGDIPVGAVVVIDVRNPGQLKLSDRPYDKRVAGVVSGGNGINPGIQMHQQGLLEGGKNIALTGRVYVQADATNGAIEPGDMLTTSKIPGHAMKVRDHAKAAGAILGKAMTPLNEGKGMVLVLVTLQ